MSTPTKETPAASTARGTFLKRAAWAGVLIAALLAGLMWLERSPPAPPEARRPVTIADAAPPRDALPRGAPSMPSAAEVENTVAEQTQDGEDTPAAPELTSAPVVADAPERVDDTPPPAAGSPRLVLGGDSAPSAEQDDAPAELPPAAPDAKSSAGAPAPKIEAPARAPDTTKAPAKDGYLVQLGVFASPDNARALHDKVEALGIPTRIESRVVVGPFRNRAQAKEAREKLRTSGLGKGLVLPSR